MIRTDKDKSEKRLKIAFLTGVTIKSAQGLAELAGAVLLIFVDQQTLAGFIAAFAHEELLENPKDPVSLFLASASQHLSYNNLFAVFYLLSHGLIKLLLIIGLIKKKLWAYYVFIAIVAAFVIYQGYRCIISYSTGLLIFTLFDVLLLYLTWKEAMVMKRHLVESK